MKHILAALDTATRVPEPDSWQRLARTMCRAFRFSGVRIEAWSPWQVLAETGKKSGARKRIPLKGFTTTVGQVLVWRSSEKSETPETLYSACRLLAIILEKFHETLENEDAFTGTVHDLRSSSRRITIFAELLLRGEKEAIDVKESLKQMGEDSAVLEHLFSTIDSWLYTRRLQRGASSTVKSALSQVLYERASAVDSRRAVIDSGGIQDIVVACEERLLAQIFRCLLDNSLAYCPDPVRVQIWTELDDDYVVIRFSDNGPGLPEADVERAFRPFQRLTVSSKGSGMGLALVRRSAMACGGWARALPRTSGFALEIGMPLHCVDAQSKLDTA